MTQHTGLLVDPRAEEPLYRQLFDQVATRIRNVAPIRPEFRLPPTRTLAAELGTHRNTVVRAYEDLESAGFVSSTVGRGTFVATQLPDVKEVTARHASGAMPWAQLVSNAVGVEPLGRADRLARGNVPPGAIALSRMQPSADLLPDELLRRCLDHVLRVQGPRAMAYPPREGLPRLRELVAQDLQRQGVPAAADDLIITTGSQQALDIISRALVNPGDPFLVDESTYAGALNLLSTAGARIIGVPTDDDGPDMAVLAREGRRGVKGLYIMPNCQNPTGARISSERRDALVAWSHASGVPIIEDDYASDLHLDGQPPLPALRALDGEVVYIGTYSKKLIPALRIGYILCPRALKPHLGALKAAMDLGTSPILQHALAEFLDRGYLRAHLGRTVAEYRIRRDALEGALARHLPAGITWRHPETGVTLWLSTPPDVDLDALYLEAQRQGVLVNPSALNAVVPGGSAKRGVRLTYCAEPPERLIEGAKRLGRAFAAVMKQTRRPGATPSAMEVV